MEALSTGTRSMSRRTIRPFGPVPATDVRSMPRSWAIYRTIGLAKIRPGVTAGGAA